MRTLLAAGWTILSRLAVVFAPVVGFATPMPYQFDITTKYSAGCGTSGSFCAEPLTGLLTITNSGPSTFTGLLRLSNVGGGYDFVDQLLASLSPGESIVLAATDHSGGQGGFGPNGALFSLTGSVSIGADVRPFTTWQYDGGIAIPDPSAAGFYSPCDGRFTSAFVLESGSETGCDNGTLAQQIEGHSTWQGTVPDATPEPAPIALLAGGLGALYAKHLRSQGRSR